MSLLTTCVDNRGVVLRPSASCELLFGATGVRGLTYPIFYTVSNTRGAGRVGRGLFTRCRKTFLSSICVGGVRVRVFNRVGTLLTGGNVGFIPFGNTILQRLCPSPRMEAVNSVSLLIRGNERGRIGGLLYRDNFRGAIYNDKR